MEKKMNESVMVFRLLQKIKFFGSNFGALGYLLNHYLKNNFLQPPEKVLAGYEPMAGKYTSVHSLALAVCAGPLANEKKNLLTYMDTLRATQMSETYINQVKSFAQNFINLDQNELNLFARHVRNAFMLSQDEELLSTVHKNHPKILKMLSIPTKVSEKLKEFSPCDFSAKMQLNNTIFDNYDNQQFLGTYNEDSLSHIQHKLGLRVNKARLEDSASFQKALNDLLLYYSLSPAVDVKLGNNVLGSIEFERGVAKRGPLVSVIMSCFNSEKTVGYAVKSLLNQSYLDIEILVCDDQSDDDSLNVLKSLALTDERVRVFSSKQNQGTYNIRNSLIPLCQGEYITFQDADDVAIPQRIEYQISDLTQHRALVTSCRWIRVSSEGEFIFFSDGLINRFCVVSTMVKKEVFGILPKFRQSLVAADTEFHELCIYMLGAENVRIMDIPLILGLWGDASLTKRPGLTAENSGYVAPKRRAYSDIAARQRVIGTDVVTDDDVDIVLKELGIYREFYGVKAERVFS